MEFVMSSHRYIAAVATFFTLVIWAFPGLACMEDPMHFEEIPMAPIECDSDLACPSGLVCEPVACCMAEDCVCPPGICEVASTGAQGRDCVADADCGPGFACEADSALDTIGWCEAQPPHGPVIRDPHVIEQLAGCQGAPDHSLPLSLALCVLFSALVRRRSAVS